MGALADIAKAKTPYLIVNPGETVVATYEGFRMIPSSFDPNTEQFQFIMKFEDGSTKFWNTGSNKIAFLLDPLEGKKVAITKTQVGMRGDKPKYSYDIVEVKSKVSKQERLEEEPEIEEEN